MAKFRLVDLKFKEKHSKDLDEEWFVAKFQRGDNIIVKVINAEDWKMYDYNVGEKYEIDIINSIKLADEDDQTLEIFKGHIKERKEMDLTDWARVRG